MGLDKEFFELLMNLFEKYADHKPGCQTKWKEKILKDLENVKSISDIVELGSSGFECNCGYTKLTNAIKEKIREYIEANEINID